MVWDENSLQKSQKTASTFNYKLISLHNSAMFTLLRNLSGIESWIPDCSRHYCYCYRDFIKKIFFWNKRHVSAFVDVFYRIDDLVPIRVPPFRWMSPSPNIVSDLQRYRLRVTTMTVPSLYFCARKFSAGSPLGHKTQKQEKSKKR